MEAVALLKWKSSMDNHSQSLLHSWKGANSSPCGWTGIACNSAGRVAAMNLSSRGIRGPLHRLDFSLFPLMSRIDLYNNSIYGFIPPNICNLSELVYLGIDQNNLFGSIPKEIGKLSRLIDLILYDNNLMGSIPSSIGNLTKLIDLALSQNPLSGSIPKNFGNLRSLRYLRMSESNLTGCIPASFDNLTRLEKLSLRMNNFTGHMPQNVCLGRRLTYLSLHTNNFIGNAPKSLKDCPRLSTLWLHHNHLSGNISEVFGMFPNLTHFDVSHNNFYGELSMNWGTLSNLASLLISNNKISGVIPSNLGENSMIAELDLSSNQMTGPIPKSLAKLSSLYKLMLQDNNLQGSIPAEIGKLLKLNQLNLAGNYFSGPIPSEIADCTNLQDLNLSNNMLEGTIPAEMGKLNFLQHLDLSNNKLFDGIPQEFEGLQRLETLNLSHNSLSGLVPSGLEQCRSLLWVDISYNKLEGSLPDLKAFQEGPFDALRNNQGLCGNNTGLNHCPPTLAGRNANKGNRVFLLIVLPALGCLFLSIVGSVIFICLGLRRKDPTKASGTIRTIDPFIIWSFDGKLTYQIILEATQNFDSRHIIGEGGCGTVYKAELPDGQIFAIKKLHTSAEGGEHSASRGPKKAFTRELLTLTNIRHKNIVKLYGFCSHTLHSFLVYKYLEGGSLRSALQNDQKAMELGWNERVRLVKYIADALSYMHHDISPPVVHGDISSNNILLDSNQTAYLSDFGTARLLSPSSLSLPSFHGTFGYMAPGISI